MSGMGKIPVAVLGATGSVGQRMVALLERHLWFRLGSVTASDRSAGRAYGEAARWVLPTPMPEEAAGMEVRATGPAPEEAVLFSALDGSIETEPLKILGQLEDGGITPASITVSAQCNRVPVVDGHTLCGVGHARERSKRRSDSGRVRVVPRGADDARASLRPCPLLGWKFVTTSHNTVRGAAGGALLCAELAVARRAVVRLRDFDDHAGAAPAN
jgi:aspartate-semialdehyde dehydrogenase